MVVVIVEKMVKCGYRVLFVLLATIQQTDLSYCYNYKRGEFYDD